MLDPAAGTLTYSRAGHNPPRLARAGDGTVASLDRAGGLPLGILGDQAYDQATVSLAAGDLLLLYTDGITEAMPGRGDRELFAPTAWTPCWSTAAGAPRPTPVWRRSGPPSRPSAVRRPRSTTRR